jgi:hypothetical protein
MNWRRSFLFDRLFWVLLLLGSFQISAQPFIPGYVLSLEGKAEVKIPDGDCYFLFQNWNSDEVELPDLSDGIPDDSLLATSWEYDQLLGMETNQPFNAFLPGFGKSSALFNPSIFANLLWFDPSIKPSARWDTTYYTTTNYSCNGNMWMYNHCNAIHYNDKNVPDSMINFRMVYIEDQRKFIPEAGFSMKSNKKGLVEIIRVSDFLPDDDKYVSYFAGRIDFEYNRKGKLIRIVSSNTPEPPKITPDWMLSQMRKVHQDPLQNVAFDSLNLSLKSENRRDGITSWLEFIYEDDRFVEGWSFTDMYSQVHCVKAEYTNNLLSKFTAFDTPINFTKSHFSYNSQNKLKGITVESQFGDAHDLTNYNPVDAQFVYNQKGELCGFQSKASVTLD